MRSLPTGSMIVPCIAPKPGISGYKDYRCRCPECSEARRAYESRRRRLIAYGQWEGLVDAGPARQYIRGLMAGGLSRPKVAELAGLSTSGLARLLYGSGGQPPCKRIRTETAEKILAVHPTLDDYPGGALIDSTATHRRIQALAAIGWSLSEQARLAGRLHKHFSPVLDKSRVPARLARQVRDVYERLSMRPAPAGYSATRTRRMAAARGWLPPLAWDDVDLDVVDATPVGAEVAASAVVDEVAIDRALTGERIDLTDDELLAAVQVGAARGMPDWLLSERLHMNVSGVHRLLEGELPPRRAKAAARRAA
jgi:AraC-like DNA-binding protein